jgi:3-phenylpropionate/trans-cinnamate dioxygenase ferredoxin component
VSFTRACALAELEDGKPLAVTVQDVAVAVVRDESEVYAIRDRCSHAEIPLSEGDVDGCLIECWLHGSGFDMRTGEPTSLPAFEPVAVYPVRLEGDDVLVDVEAPLNNVTS